VSDIRGFNAAALEAFSQRIDGVTSDAWDRPTPCADWDVRALCNHVVSEILWAPPLLEGKTIDDVGNRFDGDVLGDDPAAAWHAASEPARNAANSVPLGQTVHLSFGDFPAQEYLWQLTADLLIHAWDLARATGQSEAMPADLAAACLEWFEPMEPLYRAAGAIGDHVDASSDDALAVLLGRFGRAT
jgi:uncharacterized protein (TIGR03086 family)